jgi:DNA-binding response OmpR family regulator
MRILLADDDAPLASTIANFLNSEGHECEIAGDGEEALQRVTNNDYDLLILDLTLPLLDGTQVLSRLRSRGAQLPVLILTATDQECVACLDGGADDYLTKPFSFSELRARVCALGRRKGPLVPTIKIEDLELDCVQRTVHRGGKLIDLTPKEFKLLEYFMRNAGRRITRNMLIQDVWKLSPDTMTNVVDVYVNYLRKKIDEGAPVKLIHTVRGVGYEFGALIEVGVAK